LATGTIGVLGGGLDRIYPPEHGQLAQDLCAHGLLMSEMPLGWEARGRDFPRRNRIVAGLSLGTLVIEASRGSGSLITAKFAAEQGREIFAVPGSPLDPRAEGTNQLLRDGAVLCTRAQDVLDIVLPIVEQGPPRDDLFGERVQSQPSEPLWDELDLIYDGDIPQSVPGLAFNEPEQRLTQNAPAPSTRRRDMEALRARIEALLGPSPVGLDDLARAAQAPIGDVRSILFELEMSGRIQISGGGLICLKV
jgi:DNA processing protein